MRVIVSDHDGQTYDYDETQSTEEIERRLGHKFWHIAETRPLPRRNLTVGALTAALEKYRPGELVIVRYGAHLLEVSSVEGAPPGSERLHAVPLLVTGDELHPVDW